MKPRYTKRVREEAALICAIAASAQSTTFYSSVRHDLDASDESAELAGEAYAYAHERATGRTWLIDAEAEALIRCGWEPTP